MPSSPNYQRDYKQEYKEYQSKPEQMKNRAKRNAAHRLLEKVMGKPIHQDVDHRTPLIKTPAAAAEKTNAITNLQIRPASENRSFKRDEKARMV